VLDLGPSMLQQGTYLDLKGQVEQIVIFRLFQLLLAQVGQKVGGAIAEAVAPLG